MYQVTTKTEIYYNIHTILPHPTTIRPMWLYNNGQYNFFPFTITVQTQLSKGACRYTLAKVKLIRLDPWKVPRSSNQRAIYRIDSIKVWQVFPHTMVKMALLKQTSINYHGNIHFFFFRTLWMHHLSPPPNWRIFYPAHCVSMCVCILPDME